MSKFDIDDKKEDKQRISIDLERESDEHIISNQTSLQSQYFEEYRSHIHQRQIQDIFTKYQTELEENNIFYNPLCFQQEVSIIKVQGSQFSTLVTYFVSFSHFSFYVHLVHLPEQSAFKGKIEEFEKGSYGSVHLINLYGQNIAIKSIDLNINAENNSYSKENVKIMQNTIIEVCMTKLFSVFGVGPQLNDVFGFDLLVFQNSIVFAMEACEQSQSDSLNTLYDSLSLMHSFGIVHGDVKPENIMWSPSLQKNVFIDFGLSTVVKEKPEQKTYTAFCGTFEHSYSEMKTLLIESKKGYVDLYYNDLFGVKSSFDKREIQKSGKNNFANGINTQLRNFIENIKLLFHFYAQPKYKISQYCSSLPNRFHFTNFFVDIVSEFKIDEDQIIILESVTSTKLQIPNISPQLFEQKMCLLNCRQKLTKGMQTVKEFKGALSDVMIFCFLFLSVDETPFTFFEKNKLMLKIEQSFDPTKKESWFDFIILFDNHQVSEHNVVYIFNIVTKRTNFPSIEAKDYYNYKILLEKVRLFIKHCLEKYGFNLFEINEIVHQQKTNKKLIDQEKYKSIISGHPQLCEQTQIFRQCELEMDKKQNQTQKKNTIELFRKYSNKNMLKKSGVKIPQIFQHFLKQQLTQQQKIRERQNNNVHFVFYFWKKPLMFIKQLNNFSFRIKHLLDTFVHFFNLLLFNFEFNLQIQFIQSTLYSKQKVFQIVLNDKIKSIIQYYELFLSSEKIYTVLTQLYLEMLEVYFQNEKKFFRAQSIMELLILLIRNIIDIGKINQKSIFKILLTYLFNIPYGGVYFQFSPYFREYLDNYRETLTQKMDKISFYCFEINLIIKYSFQLLQRPENLDLLNQTIELIKSIESEQQMNSLFSMQEFMIFLKVITLSNKTNPPFDIDFMVEKAFNYPFQNQTLQMHMAQMVMYFYLQKENWVDKTVDIIVNILNFNKKHINYRKQKQSKYDVLNHCSCVLENVSRELDTNLLKDKIYQLLKQTVKNLAKDFQQSKENYIFFVTLLFKLFILGIIHLNSEQIQKLFVIGNILIPFADYYFCKVFETNMRLWCFQLLNINVDKTEKRVIDLMISKLRRTSYQRYQESAIVFRKEYHDWRYDPKEEKNVIKAKNKIKNKVEKLNYIQEEQSRYDIKKYFDSLTLRNLICFYTLKLILNNIKRFGG